MKRLTYMLLGILLAMAGSIPQLNAQSNGGNPVGSIMQTNKIYRIYSVRHPGWMMTVRQDNTAGTTNIKVDGDMAQMWVVTANGDGYGLCNVNTGRYIIFPETSTPAKTTFSPVKSFIITKDDVNHYYGISENTAGSGYKNLHTNTAMDDVVGWTMNDPGSHWVFEEVPISEINIATVKARIKNLSPFAELESGKCYRLQSYIYSNLYMAEDYKNGGKLWGYDSSVVGNTNSLIWKITGNTSNGYTLQNVLTGHYIADQSSTSTQFPTTESVSSAKKFFIHTEGGDVWTFPRYAFHRSSTDMSSLHCAASQSNMIVKWTYNGASASYWNLEPVELTEEQIAAIAQEYQRNQGFNPVNPGDPQLPVFKEYRNVTVTCTPVDAGSVSRSGSSSKNGKFEVGTSVRISRSANAKFVFKHWLKNGEVYMAAGTSTSFNYTVEEQDAAFVAVYYYNPTSPVDPNGVVSSKLYLQCEPAGACSFALTSGVGHEVDTYVKLGVYPNQDYEFIGWYEGNTFVSDVANVNYLMPYHDTTLTARFRYTWKFTPDNPDDPASQGGDIQTEDYLTGDVNRDGKVTMADAVATLNYYLQWTAASSDDAKYDVNHDGKITVADAVDVMNIYLTAQ